MLLFSICVGSFCMATGLITSPSTGVIIQKLFHSWNINCCTWPHQQHGNVCSLALPAEVMKVMTFFRLWNINCCAWPYQQHNIICSTWRCVVIIQKNKLMEFVLERVVVPTA